MTSNPRLPLLRRAAVLALAGVTLTAAAGCSSDGDDGAGTTTAPQAASSTTGAATDGGPTTTTTAASEATTTAAAGPTTTIAEADLPGERIEIYPYADAELSVVGVDRDDVLNVRVGPGTDYDVAQELSSTATGIVATGHNRQVDSGFWVQVRTGSTIGWANVAYLLQAGGTDDITSQLASLPSAETMVELGEAVAAMRASTEPPSRITITTAPSVGDLGEITVDVLGFGDDAVGGERLHVFASPNPDGESFTVRTVEATTLCTRGVDDEARCL